VTDVIDWETLQQRYAADPAACSLIDRAKIIVGKHGATAQAVNYIQAEAASLHVAPSEVAAIVRHIKHSSQKQLSTPAGEDPSGLLEFLLEQKPHARRVSQKTPQAETNGKISQFLLQAQSVIAQERGMTGAATTRLNRLAAEFDLTENERDQAILTFTSETEDSSQSKVPPRPKLFHDHVALFIANLPQPVMNFADEHQLIMAGVSEFGLSAEHAQQMVRAARTAQGIEFVSQADSARTVSSLWDEAGDNPTAEQRSYILQRAVSLGLTQSQAEELERECLDRTRKRQTLQANTATWAMYIGAGTVFAFLACFAFVSLMRVDHTGDIDSPPPRKTYSPHPWFSPRLALAVYDAETSTPALRTWLERLRTGSEEERKAAYAKLLPRGTQSYNVDLKTLPSFAGYSPSGYATVRQILTRLIHSEPCAECAKDLVDRIATVASARPLKENSAEINAYRVRAWAVETLLAAMSEPRFNTFLEREIRRRLHEEMDYTTFEPNDELEIVREKCNHRLSEQSLKTLEQLAHEDADKLWEIYSQLFGEEVDQAFPEHVERARTHMLCAYLETDAPNWDKWKGFLDNAAAKADKVIADRITESLEKCTNREVSQYMNTYARDWRRGKYSSSTQ